MAPWDGSGGFTRDNGAFTGAETWMRTANAGHNVRADQQDNHDQDIAEGLENCLARDGQNSPTQDLPMNDKKHTNVADAEARDQYATLGQLQDGAPAYIAPAFVGGTADAITLTPAPAIPAYAQGMRFSFGVKAANTGAITIEVSGLGPKALRMWGRDAEAGDLRVGDVATVIYVGASFGLIGARLGTAAYRDAGTGSGDVPLLGAGGRLAQERMAWPGGTYKTAAYQVTAADDGKVIQCGAASAAFTVTLPDLPGTGFSVTIIKTDSSKNIVTVDGHGSDTIHGRASLKLGFQYQAVTLVWLGANWRITASHVEPDLQTLTDAGTISWNVEAYPVARVVLGGNRTLAAAQNPREGGVYVLGVQQDGTGGRTLSYAANAYSFGEYGTPVIASGAHRRTFLTFLYYAGRMRLIGISRDHV